MKAPAFGISGPSWSLYSDRTEKVELFVKRQRLVDLPADCRPYVGPTGSNDEWGKLYVEHWALGETDTPAYPQSRFYLGTAIAVARRADLGKDIRLNLYSVPNRRNGSRQAETLIGQKQMIERAVEFRFNALPRDSDTD